MLSVILRVRTGAGDCFLQVKLRAICHAFGRFNQLPVIGFTGEDLRYNHLWRWRSIEVIALKALKIFCLLRITKVYVVRKNADELPKVGW